MARWVEVLNASRGGEPVVRARWCASFRCRLRGLTFRRALSANEGLLLVESRESVASAAIHMLAVFMQLGVVWLDANGLVVDAIVAKPWRMYAPAAPAKYILEGHPALLERVSVGDRLEFVHDQA